MPHRGTLTAQRKGGSPGPLLRKQRKRSEEDRMLDKTRVQTGFRIAADIGGTFTDVAAFDETSGELRLGKVLSTPDKLVNGVLCAVDEANVSLAESGLFFHGSTIVINTLLERTGVRTALITTKGFRDIYEIGRINRPD